MNHDEWEEVSDCFNILQSVIFLGDRLDETTRNERIAKVKGKLGLLLQRSPKRMRPVRSQTATKT